MTVTYEQFAEHLLINDTFNDGLHAAVYHYVTEDGAVRFFANWGYDETRDYASLKSLYEKTTGRDLPDAEDLAQQTQHARNNTVTVCARHLRTILDYLHENEADHYDDTVKNDPEDATNHVYTHVLAIEAQMTDKKTNGAE